MKRARPLDDARDDLKRPDGARTLVWVRRGRIRWAVLGSSLALAAAGVAGCGGDGDATAANAANQQSNQAQGAPPNLSADQRSQLKKRRDCMKKNGVDLPDFERSGPPQGGPPAGFDPSSSKFRSAIQKCGQYAPQGGPPGAGGPPSAGGPPGASGAQGGGPPGFDGSGATY
jgi:hypothetical protein